MIVEDESKEWQFQRFRKAKIRKEFMQIEKLDRVDNDLIEILEEIEGTLKVLEKPEKALK